MAFLSRRSSVRARKPDTKGPVDLDDYDYGDEEDEEVPKDDSENEDNGA